MRSIQSNFQLENDLSSLIICTLALLIADSLLSKEKHCNRLTTGKIIVITRQKHNNALVSI
jgi:hypothetical protein